ncbi:DUF362 domain-containing protein [Candidatus Woesearchaeota archaeon]|nr:DUF362 domain-containing protein [Candidatus Woesearchaeota archaeon]
MHPITFIDNSSIKERFHDVLKKGLAAVFSKDDKVAVKLHMGEKGNSHYLKPDFVRAIVCILKELGCKPFLFDSPVIYPGGRDTVEKYLQTAAEHGFTEQSIGCPIVISNDFISTKTKHLDAKVCRPLAEADALLVLSHVKGHMCSSLGGAIKNLGMGGVAIKTKQDIHDLSDPVLTGDCTGCGTCIKACPVGAVSLKDNKAQFNHSGCWGCGLCIDACPSKALKPKAASFDRLIAESASAVLSSSKKSYFINVLKDITRLCDCCKDPGEIVVEDIGLLLGKNIIAIEKASFDLINKKAGKDIFKEIHKKSPLEHIREGEKLEMGNMEYKFRLPACSH